jgi:hypothetical protein
VYAADGPPIDGDDEEKCKTFSLGESVAMKSVSTYPVKRVPDQNNNAPPVREGDPNADHFAIEAFSNRIVAAIADGMRYITRTHKSSYMICLCCTRLWMGHRTTPCILDCYQEIRRVFSRKSPLN